MMKTIELIQKGFKVTFWILNLAEKSEEILVDSFYLIQLSSALLLPPLILHCLNSLQNISLIIST